MSKRSPRQYPDRPCENCGTVFTPRPTTSHRGPAKTCSKPCSVAVTWKDPAKRAARGTAIAAARWTPEAKQKHREWNAVYYGDPGVRATFSEQLRRRWADPEQRAGFIQIARARGRDPEFLRKVRASSAAMWERPGFRATTGAAISTALNQASVRAKRRQAMLQFYHETERGRLRLNGMRNSTARMAEIRARKASVAARAEAEARRRSASQTARTLPWRSIRPPTRAELMAAR